jgi:DNA-binding GntR family transcriptional regulator
MDMGIRRTIVTLEAYAGIRNALFAGEWAPGDRIDRKELAERFRISQTPINDALNRLTGEGLVESRSHDGFFVPDYDDGELADLFAARAGFESIAARLCAEEAAEADKKRLLAVFGPFGDSVAPAMESAYLAADKEFHKLVLGISGSLRLNEVEASFGHAFRSYEHGLVRPPSETLSEHRAIIEAILAGAGRDAQVAMADHLLETRNVLLVRHRSAQAQG